MWGITIVQGSADHVKDHSYKWTKTEREKKKKEKKKNADIVLLALGTP